MSQVFVIDNRRCIGCHACTVACKSEHEIPLGVNRTWVKQVEVGEYPKVNRLFQVTRCNHCTDAPCVTICPTSAMFTHKTGALKGIVDFNSESCIGCKACMQSCPYGAIYLDPDSFTAAKCNLCAHRIDQGREPACVSVCPTHAILSGDKNDPKSEVAVAMASNEVVVRQPEKKTNPNVFYIDGKPEILRPENAERPIQGNFSDGLGSLGFSHSETGQGISNQATYEWSNDSSGKTAWGWPVPAYLVTKGISTGVFGLLSIFFGFDLIPYSPNLSIYGSLISLFFLVITTGLLVGDLKRPWRFYKILTQPQWKSWLTRGAVILMAYGGILVLNLFSEIFLFASLRQLTWLVGVPLAIASSVYTAFLFYQARGRDLWQTRMLPLALLLESVICGAVFLLLVSFLMDNQINTFIEMADILFVATTLHLALVLVDIFPKGATAADRHAKKEIKNGHYRNSFWWGAVVLGHVIPAVVFGIVYFAGFTSFSAILAVSFMPPVLWWGACSLALIGLFFYQRCFVGAPQRWLNG